ncbi:MAG TPA: hypothetical protein VFI39_02545 [Gemmatimonadales bacterium]|nr:hypothetical protein [Gemmatimonadales bacterium]
MRPFDRLRFALAATGVAIGIVGITRDDHRIVWVAIGCLAAAFVLRFLAPKQPPT